MDKLFKSIQDHEEMIQVSAISEKDVDYKIAERHIPFFEMLDSLNASVVVVHDYFRQNYFYVSERSYDLFGFHKRDPIINHNEFRTRFHPEDHVINLAGIKGRQYLTTQPIKDRKNFKLSHDLRVKNDNDEWIRLIIQDYILELDKKGNIWLNMKLFDLSPVQDLVTPGSSVFSNKITGEIIFSIEGKKANHATISEREKEVLGLIADGMRSKEIAKRLFIATNTVNNHRKNIMEKLNVSNSTEAVKYAVQLGLI